MLKKSLAVSILAASLAVGTVAAGALERPEHLQADRGNGPAEVDNGAGRGNPAGSNGTIKIDGFNWDGHPNNEPHIGGCTFQVDFYGFDEGDTAELNFYRWPGTGDKSEVPFTWTIAADGGVDMAIVDGAIPVGDDGAGGGVDIDQR